MGKRMLIARALGGRRSRAHGALDALTHRGDGPDGLPGSDDGGTMSAFYLFAALGLPDRGQRFPRAVTRNGAPTATVIHHGGLAGATLHYDLETAPSREPATP